MVHYNPKYLILYVPWGGDKFSWIMKDSVLQSHVEFCWLFVYINEGPLIKKNMIVINQL